MITDCEIELNWIINFIEDQGCPSLGVSPRFPKILRYNSLDNRRIVLIDTTEDIVDGSTVLGWLNSLGLEDTVETVEATFAHTKRQPYIPAEIPPELKEILED